MYLGGNLEDLTLQAHSNMYRKLEITILNTTATTASSGIHSVAQSLVLTLCLQQVR